ncbi:MAG TPA: glutamate-cysteine ligase family protein [Gemmatimonadaceae bacterium]|nr:glutamate-cysteine ligase family protein [Gemmatimonadaceae bacterium]
MSLTEAMLLEDVRQRLFSPTRSLTPLAVGAELELILVDASTREVVPASSSANVLSRLADRGDWLEERFENDPAAWTLPDGGRVSFEPGGQIEISSSPHETASSLIESLQRIARMIEAEMTAEGIMPITRGVDPYNDITGVPLQLKRQRYLRMTDYFNSLGDSGIRMMRQTAALQINVERGTEPLTRWLLLNAIAPVVIALFANSGSYAGSDTGFASYRSQLWRTLDPSRTGLAYGPDDPPNHYLEFALDAGAMSSDPGASTRYKSFRDWMKNADVSLEDWEFHLSTLFPEVRPKAYFELRSADTMDIASLAAPIVFVTGLVYHPGSARDAADVLGDPSPRLMEAAGKYGLRDAELRRLAARLVELSLRGARALGTGYVTAHQVETARVYFDHALART